MISVYYNVQKLICDTNGLSVHKSQYKLLIKLVFATNWQQILLLIK